MDTEQACREIQNVVVDFYRKAVNDVIIGYHFRHIPDFSVHIPRIIAFWKGQLLGARPGQGQVPFQLIKAHHPLQLKSAEVGRWMVLFEESLQAQQLQATSLEQWRERLEHFRQVFLHHPGLVVNPLQRNS